jgi:hypothetical protein
MTQALATEKQISFLDDLLNSRVVPGEIAAEYIALRNTIELKKASDLISMFLQFPRGEGVKTPEQLADPVYAELMEALASIPLSKYAIPVSELMTDFLKDPVHGDLVFLEVKEYMGKLFIKKLFGSVGSFTRVRIKNEDALAFVRVIKKDPYKYARKFAEHYQCCGKCGAELTDPRSRELMMGPYCRTAFGFVK